LLVRDFVPCATVFTNVNGNAVKVFMPYGKHFDYVFGTIVLTLILYGQFINTNSYSVSQCSSTIMKEGVGEINSGIKCK
jgi:hypothetical protein